MERPPGPPPIKAEAGGRPPLAPLRPGNAAACVARPPPACASAATTATAGPGPLHPPPPKRPRTEEGGAGRDRGAGQERGGGDTALPLSLSAWGLPPAVVAAYAAHSRVSSLYAWQAAALSCGADGSSLVFAAPTSGGKSLVAEVLLLRRLLATAGPPPPGPPPQGGRPPPAALSWKKALVILPYTALVGEKTAHLGKVCAPLGIGVKGYAGGGGGPVDGSTAGGAATTPLTPRGEAVAVVTIEKANGVVDGLARDGRLGELACVVVDEAHMLADPGRGAVLECLLSKLVAARGPGGGGGGGHGGGGGAPRPCPPPLQLVAMSATMAGLPAVCAWVGARLFVTDLRPTPLTEAVVVDGRVFGVTPHGLAPDPARALPPPPPAAAARHRDVDGIVPLVAEAVAASEPTLIFVHSRAGAVAAAALLAARLPPAVAALRGAACPSPSEAAAWASAVRRLHTATGGAPTPALATAMAAGVGFHHAGLSAEERAAVEAAFRTGGLAALAATSTLAAGVNLPAARVVIRGLGGGGGAGAGPPRVPRAQYLQMAGRAGRAGLASAGASFLLVRPADRAAAAGLVTEPLPPVRSQLLVGPPPHTPAADVAEAASGGGGPRPPPHPLADDPPLERLFLEAISCGLVRTPDEVGRLLGATLAAKQAAAGDGGGLGALLAGAQAALRALRSRGLLSYGPPACGPPSAPCTWAVTPKGRAVHAAGLPARAGEALFDAMRAALGRGVSLSSPLCLAFAVLPDGSAAAGRPALLVRDWVAWGACLRRARPPVAAAADALGVSVEHADAKARLGRIDPAADALHARFLTAAAASDLVEEVDVATVSARWGPPAVGAEARDGGGSSGAAPAASAAAASTALLSAGNLQRLRSDVAQRLAMGAAVASAAGWHAAAVALGRLSARAAAGGARPELLPLLAIRGLTPTCARALHSAGLTDPKKVARAAAGRVSRALLSTVRLPKEKAAAADETDRKPVDAGAGVAWGSWAAGEAARIQAAARRWVEAEAAAAAEAAAIAAAADDGWATTPGDMSVGGGGA